MTSALIDHSIALPAEDHLRLMRVLLSVAADNERDGDPFGMAWLWVDHAADHLERAIEEDA